MCLVTGGAGYLGGFMIRRLLEKGVRVHSFDLAPARESDDRITSFVGDIRNYEDLRAACEGVTTVFHTASVINLLGLYHAHQRNFVMDVNVAGTAKALKAAADAGVRQFVYTSSNNVSFDREIINGDETTPYATRPLDLYTETKGMAEKLVLDADNGKTGMRTAAVRPGGIWGGSEGGVMITTFLEQLASGNFKATVGDGSAVVDNTHIDNLVYGEMLTAEKLVTDPDVVGGEAYYILDEEPMNGILWFKPLVDGLGYKWPGTRVPKWLIYAIGYITEVIHYLGGPEPSISRISALKITRSHTFSTAKARRDLGYEPRVGQIEGLKAILPHAREQLERLKKK